MAVFSPGSSSVVQLPEERSTAALARMTLGTEHLLGFRRSVTYLVRVVSKGFLPVLPGHKARYSTIESADVKLYAR